MSRWKVGVSVILVALLCGVCGFVAGRRSAQRSMGRGVVATINDIPIYKYELDAQVQLFQQRALELLCLEKLLEEKITSSKAPLPGAHKVDDLSGLEQRLDNLVVALALANVPKSRFEEVYENFEDVLRNCDAEFVFFAKQADAEAFLEGIKSGLTFQAAGDKYGYRKQLDKLMGKPPYNITTLSQVFGIKSARAILDLKRDQCSAPLLSGEEYLVARATQVRSSYADLLPQIEQIVAYSRKQLVLNSVISRGALASYLVPLQLDRQPNTFEQLPPADPKGAGLPSLQPWGATAAPQGFPTLQPGATRTPQGLPTLQPGTIMPTSGLPTPVVGGTPVDGLPKPLSTRRSNP